MPRKNRPERRYGRRGKHLGHQMKRRTRAERKLRARAPKRRVPNATTQQSQDGAAAAEAPEARMTA